MITAKIVKYYNDYNQKAFELWGICVLDSRN